MLEGDLCEEAVYFFIYYLTGKAIHFPTIVAEYGWVIDDLYSRIYNKQRHHKDLNSNASPPSVWCGLFFHNR